MQHFAPHLYVVNTFVNTRLGWRTAWRFGGEITNPKPFEGSDFAYVPDKICGGDAPPPSASPIPTALLS